MINRFSLSLNSYHIGELLEALRNHHVSVMNAPTDSNTKAICADLVRRAELLGRVVDAQNRLDEARSAYEIYIEYGDEPPA